MNDEFTCCLKHFPGYGNNRNTHDDVSHDYRTLDYLKTHDLIPFVNSISHSVPMIMVSHNIVHDIDDEYPSSISKKVHDLLRNEYSYTGLILTDSLSMGAITKYCKNTSAGVLAVQAGNDIIVTSTFEEHVKQVIKAFMEGEIEEEIINKAARRVIAWKLKYLYKMEFPNNESDETLYIVLGVGIGLICILIIFLIIYYLKNKNSENKENLIVKENEEEEFKGNKLIRDSTQSEIEAQNNLNKQ